MSSIKAKDVIALAPSTVSLKGLVQAIQLVLVEAVPVLTEVVQVDELTSPKTRAKARKTKAQELRMKLRNRTRP